MNFLETNTHLKDKFSVNKKKDEGIYFTPLFITEYICKKSLIYYLRNSHEINSIQQLIFDYQENLDDLNQKLRNLKILDPSCGDGAFIFTMYHILIDIYKRIAKLQNTNYNPNIECEIIINNLYGVDINEENIDSLKKTLENLLNHNSNQISKINNNFKAGNSIISEKEIDIKSFAWKHNFQSIIEKGGFDIIIGNPPWGANIDKFKHYLRDKYGDILKGQFDSFSIFLHFNMKNLLLKNGIIGFALPNELCLLELNKGLRKYLLESKILELINLGFNIFQSVQKPTLIAILKKIEINFCKNHFVKVFARLKKKDKKLLLNNKISLDNIICNNFILRNQSEFLHNISFRFDIFSDRFDIEIKNIIKKNNFKPLKEFFNNGRGIDTNSEGNYIICPKCNLLNPPFGRGHSGRKSFKICRKIDCNYEFKKEMLINYNSIKLISKKDFPIDKFNAPGYIGEDLHKLYFSRQPRAFKYYKDISAINQEEYKKLDFSDIKWGKDHLYNGERILIRKVSTNHNLQVMVYKGFLITNQQIYIFKKRDNIKKMSIYYFLGILASRLIHYYYINEFGDPDKEILPHFTQKALKSLPIPIIDVKDNLYIDIIRNTKKIIQLISKYNLFKNKEKIEKVNTLKKIQEFYNLLDRSIFTLYNLHDEKLRNKIKIRSEKNGFKVI
ncbi:MAG: hypothetical protein KGD63_06505 [Candidatus Lokiarchaeota archaeon]|nr:hypothetical protein [Candidatus Lokiarchaeota archaeon]